MCFFKKKKPVIEIESKFKVGEYVLFRDKRNELVNGFIYDVHLDENNNVIYDVQVGGECPIVHQNILEDKIIKKPIKK